MNGYGLCDLARKRGLDIPPIVEFDETEITRWKPHPLTLKRMKNMKRQRDLTKLAKRYGYSVSIANGGHFKLSREGRPDITASFSPRNKRRWLTQVERDLKQADRR